MGNNELRLRNATESVGWMNSQGPTVLGPLQTIYEITVTDGGQHGHVSCSKCGYIGQEVPRVCPSCNRTVVETSITPSWGGSDF